MKRICPALTTTDFVQFKTEYQDISEQFLRNEAASDLTFVVKENVHIKAHKLIIGCGETIFQKLSCVDILQIDVDSLGKLSKMICKKHMEFFICFDFPKT